MKKVLAIDMGATSIRGILAHIEDNKLKLEEVMRISHNLVHEGERLRWQWDLIIAKITETILSHANEIESVAVDTWGVDFGCIDTKGELISNPISYRDPKHSIGHELAVKNLSCEELFENTGTQIMNINTLFQLLTLRNESEEEYSKIDKILMLPDLITYLLSGEILGEETIWSTTSMMNLKERNYSEFILEKFKIDRKILPNITQSGIVAGSTRNSKIDALREHDIKVVSVCGHDTASAVLLTKAFTDKEYMFLSCGTWSLFGTGVDAANLSRVVFEKNLTNELGYDGKTLLFKNITGLYLLEKYKSQLEEKKGKIEFSEITDYVFKSIEAKKTVSHIDMEDERFGDANIEAKSAIDAYLLEKGESLPENEMEYFRIIYESLVHKYIETKLSIEEITGKQYKKLHIIGGGAKSELLCKLIADRLGVSVVAGPFEASALGNILLQLKALSRIPDLNYGLELIKDICEIKEY